MHVEALKSEMDVFSVVPIQMTVESGKWVVYNPISSLDNNNTIEFVCPPSTEDCIDLALTMLYVKLKIVKTDGKVLTNEDQVAPVNNLLHSLFSQVEVYVNQRLVTPASNAYPYRCYIETLLNYDKSAKKSHLTASMWYKDTAGHFNDVSGDNEGFNSRKDLSRKTIEMYGPVFTDLFNVNRYLVPGAELKVKFIRSRDSFVLMSDTEDYKIHLTDVSLHVRKPHIAAKVLLAQEAALRLGPAKYPLTRTETKTLTIGKDVSNVTLDNVYLGQIPRRIVLGLVTNSAYSGNVKKNPFEFGHHHLNSLCVYVDNEQFPSKPLRPDYEEGVYTMAYYTLFSGTGIHFKDAGNDISIKEYNKGYTLYVFDLTPDLSASSGGHWSPVKTGHLRVELGFAKPTSETLNCLVYAEFQSQLEIDHHRNVVIE